MEGSGVNRRRKEKSFENNGQMGSYTDVSFHVVGETELGRESICFETKLHYYEKGSGQPLLMIHGVGQSLYTWRNNIDFFANNGYRVIALDLAGFGYSGHPNIYYTVEEQADIIKAFMAAQRIKKAHIAAFSTGALSAICLAAAHAEMIGKVIFVSPGGPNENYPFALRFLTTWLGQKVFKFFVSEANVYNILAELYFDTTMVTDSVVEGYYRPYCDKEARESLMICLEHFDDSQALSLLKSLRQETLIFSGFEDRIHNEDMIKAYAQKIPKAKHIRFRNCGHFVHEEKPLRFNTETLAFLEENIISSPLCMSKVD